MNVSLRSTRPLPLAFAGLILGAVGFLYEGGPFYDRWAKDDTDHVSVLYTAGDDRIFTNAGSHDKAAHEYRTNGAEGNLVFGPYVTLEPGRYSVSWIGMVAQASAPRFEIVSMAGGVIAAASPSLAPRTQPGRLHTIDFTLSRAVESVEFRAVVGRADALAIRAIELTALSPKPRQP